jgi:hypothetical protein
MDSLSSTLRNVGSYISQNKDLIAKPLLGAAGNLAAFGLTEEGKKAISYLMNKNNNKTNKSEFSSKDLEVLQNIMVNPPDIPSTNIIGSGIKKF